MDNWSRLCLNCFKDKGGYDVCPHCGYTGKNSSERSYYLQPGTILAGRYIMGTVIGFGGFGITYRAFDAKLDIVVAIKEFYPGGLVSRAQDGMTVEIFTRSQEDTYHNMLERFLEEARNMAIFQKEPDIVMVYDYFEDNHTAYIVMELIEGILMKDYLKQYGRIEPKDAVPLFLDILNAIGKLHANGIIHKDISPDNIFILENNKIKLLDFGAANFQGKNDEEYHTVVIKAGYAPPEQYRKDNIPSPVMDIYAAGALLYEMVTGVRPLEATDRLIQDDLLPPSQNGGEHIEENLDLAIMKAMAMDAKQRFQSVPEFYETLKKNIRVEEVKTNTGSRKYLVIQRVMLGIMSAAAVAAGVFLVRYKMDFRNYVPEDGTKLNVWVVSSDADTAQDITSSLKNNFEEDHPEVKVNVEAVAVEEYAAKLAELPDSKLPDVFCADYLPEEKKAKVCGDLSKVADKLDSVQYLFEEQYEAAYPDKNQIPMGFEMTVYYKNISKEALPAETTCMELGEVQKQVQEMTCRWISPNDDKTRQAALKALGKKKKNDALSSLVGSLSCWKEVQDTIVAGKNSMKLQIVPVVENDKLLCTFTHAYTIRKTEDANKEKTALMFIYYMLGNTAQREMSLKPDDMLPVNAKAYREYMDNLTQYEMGYVGENIKVEEGNKAKSTVSSKVNMDHSTEGVYEVYGVKSE